MLEQKEPIEQIANAAQLMYQGDMSAGELITYRSDDELGDMGNTEYSSSFRGKLSCKR